MTEHTPTPWNAASKYSSVVGVPIVNQQGKRIGNTALPDMPPEWDHLKRQAEIDAAFIVKAVNNHEALVNVLTMMLDQFGGYCGAPGCDEAITVMQTLGLDRWSMQSQMDANLPTAQDVRGILDPVSTPKETNNG